ncbi:MAG: PilN domain-containing protein [Planctomycetota bacterium]
MLGRRNLHTLLWIRSESVARVDIEWSAIPAVRGEYHASRNESSDLLSAVQQAIDLGPDDLACVWVVSDQFWNGPIALDPAVAQAAAEQDILQTLALEAEFDTGVSAFESRVAAVAQSGGGPDSIWWVAHASNDQIETIADLVAHSESRLSGLGSDRLLLPSSAETEQLPPERFALQWLSKCLNDPPLIPVIRYEVESTWAQNKTLMRAAGLLVAILICFGAHWATGSTLQQSTSQLARLDVQQRQLKQQIEAADAAQRLSDQQTRMRRQQAESEATRRRDLMEKNASERDLKRRPVQILEALRQSADQRHWLQDIRWASDRLTLQGLATGSEAVGRLTRTLEHELVDWAVSPATLSPANGTELVHFAIELGISKSKVKGVATAGRYEASR